MTIKFLKMSGKTALVTGATGLLGRQVVRAFERADWSVKGTGYSRADGSSILKVDLVDAQQLEAALDNVKYVPVTLSSVFHRDYGVDRISFKTAGCSALLVGSDLCSFVEIRKLMPARRREPIP